MLDHGMYCSTSAFYTRTIKRPYLVVVNVKSAKGERGDGIDDDSDLFVGRVE
jgi:hypothetical protein